MAIQTYNTNKDIPMLSPDCFDQFTCKGGACRNTCCQRWRIDITRAEYNKLRHLCARSKTLAPMKDDLFERMPRKNATDNQYARIKFTEDGYCPLFTKDGLCGLQLECGYPILPQTCKQYPRMITLRDDTECIRSLELSCERTLELLWDAADQPMHFQSSFMTKDQKFYRYSIKTFAESYSDIRTLCILLMQNRAYSLSDRILLLGIAMRELHELQQNDIPSDHLPAWFARYLPLTKGDTMKESLQAITGDQQKFVLNNLRFFRIFYGYSTIRALIDPMRSTIGLELDAEHYAYDTEGYQKAQETFHKNFPKIDNFFENCLVLLMFSKFFPIAFDGIWESYTYLCSLYSLMQFTAIATAPTNRDTLIDTLTELFRDTTSSSYNFPIFSQFLKITENNSLAHLAILVRG